MSINSKSQGSLITAADYNKLQEKVSSILGQGGSIYGSDYGYGQPLTSSQVIPPTGINNNTGDIITAKQMQDLRLDILKCWQHQTNDAFTLTNLSSGIDIEAGATSGSVSNLHNDFVYATNLIDSNRLNKTNSAMTIDTVAEMSFKDWNNIKIHETTITFNDSNHKRHFFNAGGEIQIQVTHPGSYALSSKSYAWQSLLTSLGTVTYTRDNDIVITSAPTELISKTGGSNYPDSYVKVKVALQADNKLFFQVIVNDPYNDTLMTGTTTSVVKTLYPTGMAIDPIDNNQYSGVNLVNPLSNSVPGAGTVPTVIPVPAYTYTLTSNTTSVTEGNPITFTVSSTVPNGTILYYSMSGTTSSDWADNTTTGSVTINNGVGSFVKTTRADTDSGTESFTVYLRTGSVAGPVVANRSAQILDQPPPPPTFTYNVTVDDATVPEGQSFRFRYTTTDTTNPRIYWSISGDVTAADFTDGVLSGTFTLSQASQYHNLSVASNDSDSASEEFTYIARLDSPSGPIIWSSSCTITEVAAQHSIIVSPSSYFDLDGVDYINLKMYSNKVPDGGTVEWQLDGASPSWFTSGQISGTATMQYGQSTSTVLNTNQVSGTGSQSFTARLKVNGQWVASRSATANYYVPPVSAPTYTPSLQNLTVRSQIGGDGGLPGISHTASGVPSSLASDFDWSTRTSNFGGIGTVTVTWADQIVDFSDGVKGCIKGGTTQMYVDYIYSSKVVRWKTISPVYMTQGSCSGSYTDKPSGNVALLQYLTVNYA